MPDMRVPGVYVFIEDVSYLEPALETGRSGYVVITSDRGPHNRIVEVTSWDQFVELFGPPDINKTGYGHYLAYAFLLYAQKLYVCRVAPTPDNGFSETESATLANVVLARSTNYETLSGTYTFRVDKDRSIVSTSSPLVELENAFVVKGSTTSFDSLKYAKKVVQVESDRYVLDGDYQGTSGTGSVKVAELATRIDAGSDNTFQFTDNNTAVVCTDPSVIQNFRIGDLILWDDGTTTDPRQYAVRVVDIDITAGKLVLEKTYTGNTSDSQYLTRIRQWADAAPAGVRSKGYRFTKGSKIVICKSAAEFDVFVDRKNNVLRSNYFWIFKAGSNSWGDGIEAAVRVVGFDYDDTAQVYKLILEDAYEGTTTSILDWDYCGVVGTGDSGVVSESTTITVSNVVDAADSNAQFYGSDWDPKVVICASKTEYDQVSEGDWIAAQADGLDYIRQVVKKYTDGSVYYLYLDEKYTGTEGSGTAIKTTPVTTLSVDFVNGEDELDAQLPNVYFYFYAVGVGDWYNNIRIRAVRNVEYEKLYTDDNGEPMYKYLFWDLYIYRIGEDGNHKLLEGPWTVSLTPYVYYSGQKVKVVDPTSGKSLYIETVVNERSKYLRCKAGTLEVENLVKSEKDRLMLLLSMTPASPVGTNNVPVADEIRLNKGSNGILYLSNGMVNLASDKIIGLIAKAYEGTLISVDGSVELIRQAIYPWYEFDYVLVGGYNANIQNAAITLANMRQDMLVLGDTGFNWSAQQDLDARLNDVPWNSFNGALYVQYRKIFDKHTGKEIWITPVYHAIQRHLYVDEVYGLCEPVAGIEKGAIEEKIELAYRPTLTEIGDLIEKQLNPTIVEPDGKYFIQQYTTWKRLSKLKYQNVAKFVHFIKKWIPKLLKGILHRRMTPYWVNEAQARVNKFMNKFLYDPSNQRWSILQSFSVNVVPDQDSGTLYVTLTIRPYGVIERIVVNIQVA